MTAIDARDRPGASERAYARLIRVYPAAFRERYREEMVRLFADQLRDARIGRSAGGVLVTWIRTLADLASSAVAEHLRKDRTVAQSLATFEPTRSMRWLGAIAVVGGVLLLWAFVSWNPFGDPDVNAIRLALFWLAGIAVALALGGRQSVAGARLARAATSLILLTGAWNIAWIILSIGRDAPFSGAFGYLGFWASFLGWLSASLYGAVSLRRAVSHGMPRWSRVATKVAAIALLAGGIVGTFGMDRLGLTRSEPYGELFSTLGALGVGAVGLGWLLLGGVLILGGRRRAAT